MGRLGYFVLGGVVGAGIALLFAPRTGEETRALVAERADEYWGKGQTWYDQGKTRIHDGIVGVQPVLNKKGDELREKIDNARTLIAEQVAKNAAAARDVINDKMPGATDKLSQAADVVRGHIDTAATTIKEKAAAITHSDKSDGSLAEAKVSPGDGDAAITVDPTASTTAPLDFDVSAEKAATGGAAAGAGTATA
jgi:gas vesicle protein